MPSAEATDLTFTRCPYCGGVGCAACDGDGVKIETRRTEVAEAKGEEMVRSKGRVLIDVTETGYRVFAMTWGKALDPVSVESATIEEALAEAGRRIREIAG